MKLIAMTMFILFIHHQAFAGSGDFSEELKSRHPSCFHASQNDSLCWIEPTAIRPTQFAVGERDVHRKVIKLKQHQDSAKMLIKYLEKKAPPAVIGPRHEIYIIDGHHLAKAAIEDELDVVYVEIEKDYSKLEVHEFWHKMSDHHLVWLFDQNGEGPLSPMQLPGRVKDLQDDPFRSLAGEASRQGAFAKTDTYFQQFIWANFYRRYIDRDLVWDHFDWALHQAIKISHTHAAKDLPGYQSERDINR